MDNSERKRPSKIYKMKI